MRTTMLFMSAALIVTASCNSANNEKNTADINSERRLENEELVKRGDYLVTTGGCGDCHSPKIFHAQGFSFDSSKYLSGHPFGSPLPTVDTKALTPGYWILASPDLTAWVGPWGMSRAANLTPDTATGIGNWREDQFIQALRTGKHLGMSNGRPIMPPMPWDVIGKMTDEDLRAIFAYLKSLPPIKNRVADPTPPNMVTAQN